MIINYNGIRPTTAALICSTSHRKTYGGRTLFSTTSQLDLYLVVALLRPSRPINVMCLLSAVRTVTLR